MTGTCILERKKKQNKTKQTERIVLFTCTLLLCNECLLFSLPSFSICLLLCDIEPPFSDPNVKRDLRQLGPGPFHLTVP